VSEQGRPLTGDDQGRRKPTGTAPLDTEEERELLELARRGDTAAYTRLVRLHQDLIFGLVSRMVRDAHLAEEVTQDAFLRAYRGLDSFRGDARFATWLYRIAVNLCRDHRENPISKLRRLETSLEGTGDRGLDPPAPHPRPDEELEAGQVADGFQTELDALDPMYREAFLLRHQEGLGYEEIAGILEISVSNAKVRVHRARELILGALRRRGFDV
jgi:RNA polymerase sigma-70 factor (ECF subfamily)